MQSWVRGSDPSRGLHAPSHSAGLPRARWTFAPFQGETHEAGAHAAGSELGGVRMPKANPGGGGGAAGGWGWGSAHPPAPSALWTKLRAPQLTARARARSKAPRSPPPSPRGSRLQVRASRWARTALEDARPTPGRGLTLPWLRGLSGLHLPGPTSGLPNVSSGELSTASWPSLGETLSRRPGRKPDTPPGFGGALQTCKSSVYARTQLPKARLLPQ